MKYHKDLLELYLSKVFQKARSNVREESYYPVLEEFLRQLGEIENKRIRVDSFPKKTEGGNPDIRVLTKDGKLIGYIEAKLPEIDNLETLEDSKQIKRYRNTFPNFILTNFLEFRLYRDGQLAGKPVKISDLRTFLSPTFLKIPVQNGEALVKLLERFLSFSTPRIYSAKALAIELAKRTRFLRDEIITHELEKEKGEKKGRIWGFYKAFQEYLIASLTPKDFADLYSQTITYGLFIARHRYETTPAIFDKGPTGQPFTRELAYKYIQPSLGILREVFQFISSAEPPIELQWAVDDIAEVLAAADLKKVFSSFYKKGEGKDPIIHFYETFLAEYDPQEREKRGVYYTPEPVVSYITRSIHYLLKEKFGREDGFATSQVTVLDPAAGTLTFPAQAIQLAADEYKEKYGSGGVKKLIKDHILKNFYAFELMMAPYAVGHLKIDFVLESLGYKLGEDERFKLYLTNTLELKDLERSQLPGLETLSEESEKAGKVKREIPIMVIMGNPPYSGHSENIGDWIMEKIKDYREIEGKSLGERNPKWLQDDYVKFFRFAQWKIEQAGAGILGFITNHAWLDNPTFRGMRYSLMKTFDEIYILNLHGSTLKKEKTPEGGKDENVFDIRPGVAIAILVKTKELKEKKIFYSDQWGLREEKYKWLEDHDVKTTKWQKLDPSDPYYFFVPKEGKGWDLYQNFWKVTDIFPVNSVGIVTARDSFVIDFDKEDLESRIRIFKGQREDDEFIKVAYNLKDKPTFHWYVKETRQKLREVVNWQNYFTKILYRPFDERWIYYHPTVIERHREEVMQHMLPVNLGLSVGRAGAVIGSKVWDIVFVSDSITDLNIFRRGGNQFFPLYLYTDTQTVEKKKNPGVAVMMLFDKSKEGYKAKRPNISPKLLADLKNAFDKEPTPEEIFYYIYTILYSNTYRQKYQEFLKIDFPRVPFTEDYKVFQKLGKLGGQLVDLHLLKSKELEKPIAKFQGRNDNMVEKREYENGRIYINDEQYFEGIKPEVWEYQIGGYQVLDKWLKDRKARILSSEDIKHYCKIISSLSKTIKIQKQIDKLYPEIEKSLVSF